MLDHLRYTLILCPSRERGNGQTTPLLLSILPKMLRPKILRPKYSFILPFGMSPVNLRLPQGRDMQKAVTARGDHSLQHLYSVLDCQIFRKDGRTAELLGMTPEASETSAGCNNHHSLFNNTIYCHPPLNLHLRSDAY